jgi:hypothetical protein
MKDGKPIDVTVVLFDGGYASTAIRPIEVFNKHLAGAARQAVSRCKNARDATFAATRSTARRKAHAAGQPIRERA